MINNYTGLSGSRIGYYVAAEIKENGKALIVVSSEKTALNLREDLAFFVPECEIIVLPAEHGINLAYDARDKSAMTRRIKGIVALEKEREQGKYTAVIAPVSAALRETVTPERFSSNILTLSTGDRIEPSLMRNTLVNMGYTAADISESPGEFSSRGGILDVYPCSQDMPARIEFWDDEIDSIRLYNPENQRSISNIDSIVIGPAAELIPTDGEIKAALRKKKIPAEVKEKFEERMDAQIFADWIEYFDVDTCRLWQHVNGGSIIIVDPSRIVDEIPDFQSRKDFFGIYRNDATVYTPFPERIEGCDKLGAVFNVHSRQVAAFNGQMDIFAEEVRSLVKAGYEIRIVSSSAERGERIREYIDEADIHGRIEYLTGSLSAGMVLEDYRICYIAENDIFPQTRKKPLKRRRKSKDSINFSDLHEGDYVVHEQHGIGRFIGIKPVTADGITSDYLVIKYAGTDVLYIPTEQLDIIQKYIGSGGNAPNLSKLSGGSWRRTRERAKKAIMEIAEDLVKLYAEREAVSGYAFPEDSVWQTEFEEGFPYTETEDQLKCAEEIKTDMQRSVPMDRLLCGDVGYGKTEVAARAIFKCISEGKQAAILAPTTLLVNQHYHNLLERFENFPFEIEMLSRFRSQAQIKEILKKLERGSIDLIIGTHRLLSDDVKFKDIGLLVIDEEQRFGVKHKERIKMLRKDIDVLTLSATPIPRTLNMSLTGIKDISTIDEPPGDRYPVQTYVSPEDDELLSGAISRELARGGQVFVVDNRISDLKQLADRIEELVPEAEIVIGHGRMSEEQLEDTMLDFIEGRANVLIATTIIENGIDIPNANTMIIMNADRLGLAQLYQLRGRVGRSNRIAYAYLMYRREKVLTDIARKRLTAIREFTEFGAGFKLAMRDLELRGAGNVLGEAQSGHIEGIGYELYCKEIDRAVRQLKGEVVTETRADISIEIPVQASIPSAYIEDQTLRLQAYKKIAGIFCREDAEDILDELIDRYGDAPQDTVNLIKVAELRAHAERIGISSIAERGNRISISFAENNKLNPYMLVIAREAFGDALTITSGTTPGLSLYCADKNRRLTETLELARSLRESLDLSEQGDKGII